MIFYKFKNIRPEIFYMFLRKKPPGASQQDAPGGSFTGSQLQS